MLLWKNGFYFLFNGVKRGVLEHLEAMSVSSHIYYFLVANHSMYVLLVVCEVHGPNSLGTCHNFHPFILSH